LAKTPPVEAWLAARTPEIRGVVERLRAVVLNAADGVTEHIKWNGPSFCIDGDDRITVGLAPGGGVRAILHRGVKVKDATGFAFADDSSLIRWAAPDRGVVTFADEAAVAAGAEVFADICRRWFEATR
jgi:hypothetical protein